MVELQNNMDTTPFPELKNGPMKKHTTIKGEKSSIITEGPLTILAFWPTSGHLEYVNVCIIQYLYLPVSSDMLTINAFNKLNFTRTVILIRIHLIP